MHFYLAIQRSVWRDIKFAFFCTVEDITTQDGAIGVKFWLRVEQTPGTGTSSGMIGPWGPWGGGLNFYFTLRSMGKYCVIHITETRAWGDRHQIRRVYTSCAPRSILRFWGRSVEGVPAAGVEVNIFGVRVLIFVNRTATFCFYLSVIKCSPILRG